MASKTSRKGPTIRGTEKPHPPINKAGMNRIKVVLVRDTRDSKKRMTEVRKRRGALSPLRAAVGGRLGRNPKLGPRNPSKEVQLINASPVRRKKSIKNPKR